MGRKKRKAEENIEPSTDHGPVEESEPPSPPSNEAPPTAAAPPLAVLEQGKSAASSHYAVQSHSAEIVGEDIYVSSEGDDDDDEEVDIVLSGSRMGLMRRGLHHPSLVQSNRQWSRAATDGDDDDYAAKAKEEEEEKQREEELAKLDPAQRAARLLAEKLRKLEEAKETARRVESEENAGRDPCLFSKRTAFDIRMDQIEEKPWEQGGDLSEYFNYNMAEADWLDYSQQQLQIRQELSDAVKQRRSIDSSIVPVAPRTPNKQNPRVAVAGSIDKGDDGEANAIVGDDNGEGGSTMGPALVKKEDEKMDIDEPSDGKKMEDIKDVGLGGAWGAGVAPGSKLARLIEEQERNASAGGAAVELNASDRGDDRYSEHYDYQDDQSQRSTEWRDRGDDYHGGYQASTQYSRPARGGHFPTPPHAGGPPPPFYGGGRGRGYRQPHNPPNPSMGSLPPWAERGRRGGYGGGRYGR